MSRAVYIGGFGNGQDCANRVGKALEQYYDEIDTFTFTETRRRGDLFRRAVRGADVITHSAGMFALRDAGTRPASIEAYGAPLPYGLSLPAAICKLAGRTVAKTVRMHRPGIGMQTKSDVLAVARYDASASMELLAHLWGNLGQLGRIATFNAVQAAITAQREGISATLVYNESDEYFTLPPDEAARARANNVRVMHISGIHDELVIRPQATFRKVDEQKALG